MSGCGGLLFDGWLHTKEDNVTLILETIEYSEEIQNNICFSGQCNGSINLDVTTNTNVTYEWSNGATTQNVSGLCGGDYTVDINSSGCSFTETYTVTNDDSGFDPEAVVQNSLCVSPCNGSIDLIINAPDLTYQWSNGVTTQNLDGLCGGDYSVTISDGICDFVKTFSVIVEEEPFEYEVEVLRHFYSGDGTNGAAVVIHSSTFSGPPQLIVGTIDVYDNSNMIGLPIASAIVSAGSSNFISISNNYALVDSFYFRHTGNQNSNGCIHEGEFDGMDSCVDSENDCFSYTPVLVGNVEESCGTGSHSYDIEMFCVKGNPPYYIEVTMINAFDPFYQDYTMVHEYPGPFNQQGIPNGSGGIDPFFTFPISGVPSGEVQFRTYNNCHDGNFVSAQHTNCCYDITCQPLSEGYNDNGNGDAENYEYFFNYFDLYIRELCFETDCNNSWENCSAIEPTLNGPSSSALLNNCWYGTVTIDYPTGPNAIFHVIPADGSNGVYDLLQWDAMYGQRDWEPGAPGSYDIYITYQGDQNQGSGISCNMELEIDFFGANHRPEAIVFADPDAFLADFYDPYIENAYFTSNSCGTCGREDDELYLFDVNHCDYNGNWQNPTYFMYDPIDFGDPCNSGGVLTIMDFNDNGEPEVQTIVVPPNLDVIEHPDLRAFHEPADSGEDCASGWCNFLIGDIYEANFDFGDKRLIATWYNADDCEDIQTECDDDNPCLFGECDEFGNCIPTDDDGCIPDCPPGFNCVNNECEATSGTIDCESPCDCPTGQTCNNDSCVDIQGECEEDCQCPDGYECNFGQCVPVITGGCSTCNSDQYCYNLQCHDCPIITVNFCWSESTGCGVPNDCILEIEITSNLGSSVPHQIEVVKKDVPNGNIISSTSYNLSLFPTQVLYESLACNTGPFNYDVIVTFDDCLPITRSTGSLIDPQGIYCDVGCFTGGSGGEFMVGNTSSTDITEEHQALNTENSIPLRNAEIRDEVTNKILVYPNPFDNMINVKYEAEEEEMIEIKVSDIYGKQMQKESYEVNLGTNEMQLSLKTEIPTGVYFILISNDKGDREVFKLLHANL